MKDEVVDETPVSFKGDKAKVAELIKAVRKDGRSSLSESEGKEILRAYGIGVPMEITVRTADEAAEASNKIGYPVVLKIDSPDIAHKSDVGGVVVGVASEQDDVRTSS